MTLLARSMPWYVQMRLSRGRWTTMAGPFAVKAVAKAQARIIKATYGKKSVAVMLPRRR